uniref:Uncharacterized protein n=1 Tax=Cuerna arida TaxID=1464854 RepID=A0A1B6FNT7_9HEMI
MNDSDIEDALFSEILEITDLQNSGSEYVPSDSGSNSDSEDEITEDDDEMIIDCALTVHSVNSVNISQPGPSNTAQGLDAANVSNQNYNRPNNIQPGPSHTPPPTPNEAAGSDTWGVCTGQTDRQFPFTGQEGLLYDFDRNDPMTVYRQSLMRCYN